MHVERQRLLALLNTLYDEDVTSIPLKHPCEELGELARITLLDDGQARIEFTQGSLTYQDTREAIPAKYGEPAYEDLPDAESYTRAVVASGLIGPENPDEIDSFIERHGYPDLEAGHSPVFLGVDTNILAWRLPEVLNFDSETGETDDAGRSPTNGYVLPTGLKGELDWHYKQHNTHELTEAFGEEFSRLDAQPAGSNREGFLGLYEYRRLEAARNVDVIESEQGDEAIVAAYEDFNDSGRKNSILISNDHGFIERARDAGVPAQHIAFPVDLPQSATGSWTQACDLIYLLSILFGVLVLPKVTLYGVWNGKDGFHWQHEQLHVECRSPKFEPRFERDLRIVEAIQ